jgi:hypothetical protein
MTQQELIELLRMVASGRRDAADKLAELLHPLLKGDDAPKVTKRKIAE